MDMPVFRPVIGKDLTKKKARAGVVARALGGSA